MVKYSHLQKRKRGVILSPRGWQRLQIAEQRTANQHNSGKPYTLEQLGDRTGLSPNTITKVRRRQIAVDRQSLEVYFNALSLTLTPDDYISLDPETALSALLRRPLKGQVPLDSPFYIERPPAESQAYEEVLLPGALIRIKASQQMGKTSLMARTLAWAQDKGLYNTVLNIQLADASVLTSLDRFLRWFCAVITQNLQLPNRLEEIWDEVFGSSYNCTYYFETCILAALNGPLVLALDGIDGIFNYPDIASDFFGMLRAWYEKARYGGSSSELWQRLRLIVVHSTEVYLPLDRNQSPFNVGLSIELNNFTLEQVQDLAHRYGIESPYRYATELIDLLGGNPYLTQLALYHLSSREIALEQLSAEAIASDSIFSPHLRSELSNLQPYPELLGALKQVVLADRPVELHPVQAFKLQSMGLVRLSKLHAVPCCKLYQHYFAQVLPIF